MAKNYYAVKKGRKTGIFCSWDECSEAIHGFAGAEFKGFAKKEDAEAYLKGEAADDIRKANDVASPEAEDIVLPEAGCVIAYVDGSFEQSIGRYAFGCVMIQPDGSIERAYGSDDKPEAVAIRNVAGEMQGAMYAVACCVMSGYKKVILCYDYQGIACWATGSWRAKNELTASYARYMRQKAGQIEICFRKIKAHTGDKYNEEADRLAKKALTEAKGVPKIKRLS